jgi:hypothetical protein
MSQSACLANSTSTPPTGTPVVAPTGTTAATMFDGNSVTCLCTETVYYTACVTFSMASQAGEGWLSAPSNPGGCDYNGCSGIMCQQNFCQLCPNDDPSQCASLSP